MIEILVIAAIVWMASKSVKGGAKVVGNDYHRELTARRAAIAKAHPNWSERRRNRIAGARALGATASDLLHLGPAVIRGMRQGWQEASSEWGSTREEHQAWRVRRHGELAARREARGGKRPTLRQRIGDWGRRRLIGPVPQVAFVRPPAQPRARIIPFRRRQPAPAQGDSGTDDLESEDPAHPNPGLPEPGWSDTAPDPGSDPAPVSEPGVPAPAPAGPGSDGADPGSTPARNVLDHYSYADPFAAAQATVATDPDNPIPAQAEAADADPASEFWAARRAQQRQGEYFAANGWRLLIEEGYSEDFLASQGIHKPPDPAPAGPGTPQSETAGTDPAAATTGENDVTVTGEFTSYESAVAAFKSFSAAAAEMLGAAEKTAAGVIDQASAALRAAEQMESSFATAGIDDDALLGEVRTMREGAARIYADSVEMERRRTSVIEGAASLDSRAAAAEATFVRDHGKIAEAVSAAPSAANDTAFYGARA